MRGLLSCGSSVMLGLSAVAAAEAGETRAPQLALRSHAGQISNIGSGGSTTLFGGINVALAFALTPRVSVGPGIKIDVADGIVPLKSYDARVRYALMGDSFPVRLAAGGESATFRDPVAVYVGAQFAYVKYFLVIEELDESFSGDAAAIDALVGVDLALSGPFGLNLEASYTVMSFSATDSRFRFRSMLAAAGLTYVW